MATAKKSSEKDNIKKKSKDSFKNTYVSQIWKGLFFIIGIFFGLGFFASMAVLQCHSSGGFCAGDFDEGRAKQMFLLGFVSVSLITFSITKNRRIILIALSMFTIIALLTIYDIKGR